MDTQNIVKFENGELQLDVSISVEEDTVWLTQEDMGLLFGKNKSTISRHIASIFKEEELNVLSCVAKNATQLKKYDPRTGKERLSNVIIAYYNLDVIISVGYRVKSKQGIIFRKWANKILKEYMKKGMLLMLINLKYLILKILPKFWKKREIHQGHYNLQVMIC